MARTINLHDGKTKLVHLKRGDINIDLEKCNHNFALAAKEDRVFSVVMQGFVTPLVITINESAIARVHGEYFDLQTSLGINELIADAIARVELTGMTARKSIRINNESVARVELSIGAKKPIAIESDSAIARAALRSLARAVELDAMSIDSIARCELGKIYLLRLRTMEDDADYTMTDDFDLSLSEIYKWDEMR